MAGKRKSLGLVLAALAVLGALGPPGAQAATKHFNSALEPTTWVGWSGPLVGGKEAEIGFQAGTVKCAQIRYGGAAPKKTETVALAPGEFGCGLGGLSVTVVTNDCAFLFHSERETVGGASHVANVDIDCKDADGKETGPIVFTAALFGTTKCKITLLEQSGMTGVTFTNAGNPGTIVFDMQVSGLVYTQHAGSGLGACTSLSGFDGTYKDKFTMKGFDPELKQVSISYE